MVQTTAVSLLIHFYAWLLCWYPANFRTEFEEEMTAVFTQTMTDAAERDKWTIMMFILRELRDLPLNLAREHWHALTKKELPMTPIKKPEWSFYLAWIILTALCVPVAFIINLIILRIITLAIGDFIYVDGVRHITEDYLFGYTFVPILSLLMGLLQYSLLRRYLPRMGWWVLATAGGWLLGLLLVLSLPVSWGYESWGMDLIFTLLGFSIGVGQWLLLRRRLLRAEWWIGANIVGWGLLALITGNPLHQFDFLLLGFVPTCVTAVVLGLLMNRVQPTGPQGA